MGVERVAGPGCSVEHDSTCWRTSGVAFIRYQARPVALNATDA